MIPPELDFQRLKSYVSIEMVLAAKGLLGALTRRGNRLFGPCPLHKGDNPTAFVVTLSRDLWHCFTRCDAGGDVVSLVQSLDRATFAQAAAYLATLAGLQDHRLPRKPSSPQTSEIFRPYTRVLPLRHDHPLLADKGIRPQTAADFCAGAFFGAGFLDCSLAVRLFNLRGRPLGYAGRRFGFLNTSKPKWCFPLRFPKAQLLFNWHRVQPHRRAYVVLTECPWGVMRLHQLAIPAVALLGTHLSPTQRQLLSLVSRVILLLDGDQAGRDASVRIWQALKDATDVRIVNLPQNLDPDDLPDVHLAALLQPFLF